MVLVYITTQYPMRVKLRKICKQRVESKLEVGE